MLYETAARTGEILALDIEDIDLPRKRAVIIGKGGHKEYVFWASGAARLSIKVPSRATPRTRVPHPPATQRHPRTGGRMPTHQPGKAVLRTGFHHLQTNHRRVDTPPTPPLLAHPPRRERSLHHPPPSQKSTPRPHGHSPSTPNQETKPLPNSPQRLTNSGRLNEPAFLWDSTVVHVRRRVTLAAVRDRSPFA